MFFTKVSSHYYFSEKHSTKLVVNRFRKYKTSFTKSTWNRYFKYLTFIQNLVSVAVLTFCCNSLQFATKRIVHWIGEKFIFFCFFLHTVLDMTFSAKHSDLSERWIKYYFVFPFAVFKKNENCQVQTSVAFILFVSRKYFWIISYFESLVCF